MLGHRISEVIIMGKTRNNLTPKMLHFCRCVAAGMGYAEAYRESHAVTATGKSATHREAASRLMARADIRARGDALVRQRERSVLASALSDKERVLSKLRHWLDHAESGDSNRIRSAELLGRSIGLFKDVVETTDSRSSEELLAELDAMLEQAEPDQPNDSDDQAEATIMH